MKTILIKPVITEKMTAISEKENKVGFIVSRDANKIEIKKAVEDKYGVKVESVNTMNYAGKAKFRYTRAAITKGRTNAYKKAIVQLADGDVIDFYEHI
jgi:large subunit ribosomal protein L23